MAYEATLTEEEARGPPITVSRTQETDTGGEVGGRKADAAAGEQPAPDVEAEAERPPAREQHGEAEPGEAVEPAPAADVEIRDAVRRTATLTQGSEAHIRKAIADGVSNTHLIKFTSKAGWGGGGRPAG